MKGLNKLALATAIAAAPFAANAELQAMNDSAMGNVTGQAGVTIELETEVSIGQFKYTDEGSFAVNDIKLGGSAVGGGTGGDLLDQLKIDIDVADDGDAVIHVGSLQTENLTNPFNGDADVSDGNGGVAQKPVAIDWGMTVGSMELIAGNTGADGTTLISNMSAYGNLAVLDIRVDTATDELQLDVAFDIENMDFDVDFLAVGVRDMVITGAGNNFDYDNDGKTVLEEAGMLSLDTSTYSQEELDAYNAVVGDGVEGHDIGTAAGLIALGKLTNYANVGMDIYKGDGLGASSATGVLRIDIDNIYMDVNIGDIQIGGDIAGGSGLSIGSVALDNLAVTRTKLAIYGH